MSEPIFMFDAADPRMRQANEDAQRTFKYFWRELSWENRRIVPALDMAMIKLPFTDSPRTDGNYEFEQMWVDEVRFDGQTLTGQLINSPNWLTSVKEGDAVQRPFSHLTDWIITADGAAYGAFTVNLMRSRMSESERRNHDQAWGLDFGNPNEIRTGLFGGDGGAAETLGSEGGFLDHPMCTNMLETFETQLKGDASIARSVDDTGWTLLQRDALAGNFGVVKLLVRYGADLGARTPAAGHTAADLARAIGWTGIAAYLDQQGSAAR
jgi:uncharacterized protein YegJ (DUF2314 family)